MVAQNHSVDQSSLIAQLRNKIRSAETAGRIHGEVRVSSGCAAIDGLLPGNGYQRGTLVQWLTGGGQAADYLSLLAAKQAAQDGGAIVIFDPHSQFYPPAAAAIGINLDNLIILKSGHSRSALSARYRSSSVSSSSVPSSSVPTSYSHSQCALGNEELDADLLWSIDQALRCPAVAAVWGPVGRIDERWFRRFQLSAESSGCVGHFVQPIAQVRQPSWADVQWLVSNSEVRGLNSEVGMGSTISSIVRRENNTMSEIGSSGSSCVGQSRHLSEQLVRLQLSRCRGTQTGKTVNLSINTITGNVQTARRDYETQTKKEFGGRKEKKTGGRRPEAGIGGANRRQSNPAQW